MYVSQENNSACVFISFPTELYFIGDNICADNLKDEITPFLKANNGLKFAHDVALNRVRDKGKL